MRADLELLQEAVKEHYEPIEYRACQIALIYERLRREFFKEPYTCLKRTADKRTSRCFPHFYKLANIENRNRDIIPDMSLYLRAQFEITKMKAGAQINNVPVPPQHLHTRLALGRYKDYIMQLIPTSLTRTPNRKNNSRIVIRSLGNTATLLTKLHMDLFESSNVDYWKLMNHTNEGDYQPLFFLFVLQNFISPYFLCASKHYPSWIEQLDTDCKMELPQNLDIQRGELLSNPQLLSFGRSAFGSEFIL